MIDQTIRLIVEIPAGDIEQADIANLPLFFDLIKIDAINDNILRRFKFAKIQGKFYDGKSRGELLVGDTKEAQVEYVDSTEDYTINGAKDLQTLVVVSTNKKPVKAVVILQF